VVSPGADPSAIFLAIEDSQSGDKQKAAGGNQKAVRSRQGAEGSKQQKADAGAVRESPLVAAASDRRTAAGTQPLQIAANGDLLIPADGCEIRLRKPVVYQERSGARDLVRNSKLVSGNSSNRQSSAENRQFVEGRYLLDAHNRIRFALGPYDHSKPLIIDPALALTVEYSTLLPYPLASNAGSIAADPTGAVYITGTTSSATMPVMNPLPAPNNALHGSANIFVAKMNPAGTALVYSTYLGGTGSDSGGHIAIDSSGNAYVAGGTTSTDFPVTSGAYQATLAGTKNVTVTELNATGNAIIYSTYLGGSGSDAGVGLAVAGPGIAYVTGITTSNNFPTTSGVFQTALAGNQDAFVAEINTALAGVSSLVFSTYLGGNSAEYGAGIGVDSTGNVTVAGITASTNFPTLNAYQSARGVAEDLVFVTKLNPTGTALVYSTYLGGGTNYYNGYTQSAYNLTGGLAVDSAGNAYVGGYTDAYNFPVHLAYQSSYSTNSCTWTGFVAKFDPTGSNVYSSFFGGTGYQSSGVSSCAQISSIAADSSGNAYFTGYTEAGDLPLANPVQAVEGGGLTESFAINAFVSELSAGGSSAPTLLFSTYLGGTYQEEGSSIALDGSSNIYVAGLSYSADFPTIAGSYETAPGEDTNFLVKIGPFASPALALTPQTVIFAPQAMGSKSSARIVLVHDLSGNPLTVSSVAIGGTQAADFAQTNTCSAALPGGTDCSVSVSFTPPLIGPETATLTVTATGAIGSPTTITLQGTGASDGVPSFNPNSDVDFGSVLEGSSNQQTVMLTNTGTGPLAISSVVMTQGAPDFTQTNNCPASLAVNVSCNIVVTYNANVLGYDSGTLTLTDDSPTSPETVSIFGNGALPIAQLSSTSWNYGSWAVGSTSFLQNFFMTDNGGFPLTFSRIAITGPNAGDFQITANTCGASVAAYNNCGVTVVFVPSVYGPESASLTFTDNSNNLAGSMQAVTLTGTGVNVAQLSAASLNFGNQVTNVASGPRTETLTNYGSSALAITNIAATGPFTQTNNCGSSLAAKASCKITINFTPPALGSQTGSLSVTYTGPNSPQTLTLGGTGISPPLTACPTSFQQASMSYGHLPLSFAANAGQADPQVKFLSRGRGYGLFLTSDEAVLELQKAAGSRQKEVRGRLLAEGITSDSVLRMRLVGSNANAKVTGRDELRGKSNYLIGNDPSKWVKGAPTFAKVRYEQVYPGIDVVYYGNQRGQLEYDFEVTPGADPSAISMALDVAAVSDRRSPVGTPALQDRAHRDAPLQVAANGDLVISTGDGEVVFHKPLVYQQESGLHDETQNLKLEAGNPLNRQSAIENRQFVSGRFVLSADNKISFALGPYDRTRPLVIDPDLNYATYVGGSTQDLGIGIAVDSTCSAYISGQTTSPDFPVSGQGAKPAYGGGSADAFVTKLSPDGTAIVYSTFLGGSNDDEGRQIAVDSAGNAYVTGLTQSSNFPVTASAFQNGLAIQQNAFLSELSADGSTLLYSTYFGAYLDEGYGIALDSAGNAYIAGRSPSSDNYCDGGCDFPVTAGAYQQYWNGTESAFVAKFNTTASGAASLVYSTLLGGSGVDRGFGIAVDSGGNAYVTGRTNSSDFPTMNAYQAAFGGGGSTCSSGIKTPVCGDAFVTELNSTGTALLYSTYLGGSGEDGGVGIALDTSGKVYISGGTDSGDFPVSNAAYQASFDSNTSGCSAAGLACGNAFVAKLDATQSGSDSLLYATYLGGENDDLAAAIVADANGFATVAGVTNSTKFPKVNPLYSFGGGTVPCVTTDQACGDGFVAKLDPSGSKLVFSTYLGGSQDDGVFGLAIDSLGNAYLTGVTNSPNFHTTPGTFQMAYGGGTANAFAARIGYIEFPIAALSPPSLTFAAQNLGVTSSPQSVTLTNTGDAPLSLTSFTFAAGTQGFAQTNNCPVLSSPLAVGASCQINVTYTPTQSGSQSDTLVIDDNEPTGQQTLILSGAGNGATIAPPSITISFGADTIPVGGTTSLTYVIKNPNANLTVSGLAFTDYLGGGIAVATPSGVSGTCNGGTIAAVAGATIVSLAGASLAPLASCTFSINITGTSAALTTNVVYVSSSNAGTGSSNAATLSVILTQGVVSPTVLGFGNQSVTVPSAPQSVMLQNVGSTGLSNISIIVVGTNAGDFTLGGTCGTSLVANSSCQITVSFNPQGLGARSASLEVIYPASGSPQTVSLSGTGVGPNDVFGASSLSFQHNLNLTCPPKAVTLQNTGTGPLLIQSISAAGTFSQTNTCGTTLAAGASCEIDVTFTAESPIGVYNGSVTVADNAGGSPHMIPLAGQVFPACLMQSAPPAQQVLRSTPAVTFNLSDGQPSCHTAAIALACVNNQPATCAFNPPAIAPGGSTVLTVQNLNAVGTDNFNFTATATDVTNTTSVDLSVRLADFTFAVYPSTATVTAGQSTTYAMTLSPVNGLAGTIQLGCSGTPTGSTCSVTPGQVTLAQNAPAQISMAVATAGRSTAIPRTGPGLPSFGKFERWRVGALLLAFLALLAGTAAGGGGRLRHPVLAGLGLWGRRIVWAAMATTLLVWVACGGGGGGTGGLTPNPGTPAGTYTLTVTGTYVASTGQPTALARSQSVTLQVK